MAATAAGETSGTASAIVGAGIGAGGVIGCGAGAGADGGGVAWGLATGLGAVVDAATAGGTGSIGAFMIDSVTPMETRMRAMPPSQNQRVMGETGSLWALASWYLKEGEVEGRARGEAEPRDRCGGVLGVAGIAGVVSIFHAGGLVCALGYLKEVGGVDGRGSGAVVSCGLTGVFLCVRSATGAGEGRVTGVDVVDSVSSGVAGVLSISGVAGVSSKTGIAEGSDRCFWAFLSASLIRLIGKRG